VSQATIGHIPSIHRRHRMGSLAFSLRIDGAHVNEININPGMNYE